MNLSLTLLEKINNLCDGNSRKIFLQFYEQKEFNIMFRQTATRPENLEIADFLYLNREEFKIDVNAKGKSNKNALDFAIEKSSKANVLFLLKLKETEVDNLMRDKINNKFGQDFRTTNIAPNYVSLGDKLIMMHSRVKQYTTDYSKNLSTLVDDLKTKSLNNLDQVKSINSEDEFIEIRLNLFFIMRTFVDNYLLELSKLSNEFEDFEDLFNLYLPYSYAQEKLLNGNEIAKSNMNSTMKNTCLHNRKCLEETAAGVRHNKMALISNFDEVMQLFILNLTLFEKQSTPSININPKDEDDSNPQINEPDMPEPSQENQHSPGLSSSNPTSKHHLNKPNSKANSGLDIPNAKLDRLKSICDELNQLKQKGQVKLSAFHSIIKNLSKEIDLQIKPTKKGFMVNQSTNHFSFHRSHEDKGVDKAAVHSLKSIVEENIKTIANSNLKGVVWKN